jgi:hypothetical protein
MDFFTSHIHAICLTHLIFLDLIALVLFGKENKLQNSSITELSPSLSYFLLFIGMFADTLNL